MDASPASNSTLSFRPASNLVEASMLNGTGCQALGVEDCIPGLYCPRINSSSPLYHPVKCLPTPECETLRLLGHVCPNVNSSFGAMGPYEPVVCPPGYYCSTPRSIERWYGWLFNYAPLAHVQTCTPECRCTDRLSDLT